VTQRTSSNYSRLEIQKGQISMGPNRESEKSLALKKREFKPGNGIRRSSSRVSGTAVLLSLGEEHG